MQTQPQQDRDLVVLALSGNQQAFSQLMLRHKESLLYYIRRQFSIGEAADDLLLIIFDKAFRKLESYDPQFAFSTWLFSIAEHSCIDHIRKQKALLQSLRFMRTHDPNSSELITDQSNPESDMIASQEVAMLLHCINKLKPIYREPARLRFLHDYAYEEIAKELSIPQGTVKTRIHRAKEILAKWITPS